MSDAMRNEEKRKDTFVNGVRGKSWPHHGTHLHPARMASAGLYFDPTETAPDGVRCFECKGLLQCWDPTDSPWVDHRTHYPKCAFVLSAAPAQLRKDPGLAMCCVASPTNDTQELLIETFKLLEILFNSMDKDGLKIITMKQLCTMMSTRGFVYGVAFDRLVVKVDGNNDGVLSFSEFVHLIFCCARDPLLKDMSSFFGVAQNQKAVSTLLSRVNETLEKLSSQTLMDCKLNFTQFVQFCQSILPAAFSQPAFQEHLEACYPSAERESPVSFASILSNLYYVLSSIPNAKIPGKYVTKRLPVGVSPPSKTMGVHSSEWQMMQAAMAALENDFIQFDLNGNGLVDLNEIKSLIPHTISSSEKLRIQSLLQRVFQAVDRERSCQLDFFGFMAMAFQLCGPEGGSYSDLVHDSSDSATIRSFLLRTFDYFKKCDTDRNNRLTIEEVSSFLHSAFGSPLPQVERIFNEVAKPSESAGGRLAVDVYRFIKVIYMVIRPDGPFDPSRYDPHEVVQIPIVTSIPVAVPPPAKLARIDPVIASNFNKTKILSQSSKAAVTRIDMLGSYNGIVCKARVLEGTMDSIRLNALNDEVKILSHLDHPNCEQLLGAKLTITDGGIILLFEICETGSLFDFYTRNSSHFDMLTCLRIARESASGLLALHELGYMHRNVKSPNVLLAKGLIAKISEFGSATTEESSREIKGTIQWMAPEILSNWFGVSQTYGRSCDVYSFGILLWEIFHCTIPYAEMAISQNEIAQNVFQNNRRPIISRACPESLEEIMIKCWDRQSSSRPNFRQVIEMLDAAKDQLSGVTMPEMRRLQGGDDRESAILLSMKSPISNKKSLHAGPTDVYVAWKKPHVDFSSAFKAFVVEAGDEAASVLKELQRRHQPISFEEHPKEAISVIWEEKWSSTDPSRDHEGEDLMMHLAVLLRQRQIKFKDPFFPAEACSLFVDPRQINKHKNASTAGRTDQAAFLAGKDVINKVQWKRPSELLNPNDKVKVWSGSISPEDVMQGSLGNCYFMAALAACASEKDDVLLKDLLIEDYADVGIYGVKFFLMGRWITVVVDDLFPCELFGTQWKPLFCTPKKNSLSDPDTKEIWPLLFEKAFAKLHGSYECTDAGFSEDALQYLTAGVVEVRTLTNSEADFEWLHSAFEEGTCAHGACTPSPKMRAELNSVGLVSGHAYSVLKAVRTKCQKKLIQVRNPWGRVEWKGNYSDKSSAWTSSSLKEEVGFRDEEDGSFFMEFCDFVKYFGKCKKVDPRAFNKLSEDHFATIDGAASYWLAGKTAGGKAGSPTFGFNPAFDLTGDSGDVIITVYQADIRHTVIWPVEDELYEPFIDVHVYFGEVGQRLEEIQHLYGDYDGDRLGTAHVRIEKGRKYRVVVAAGAPGLQGSFSLTACGRHVQLASVVAPPVPPDAAARMAVQRRNPKAK